MSDETPAAGQPSQIAPCPFCGVIPQRPSRGGIRHECSGIYISAASVADWNDRIPPPGASTAGQDGGELAALSEANRKAIEDYLSMYEMVGEDARGADAYYEPTDGEKILLADAINGLLADTDFVKTYDAERFAALTSERDQLLRERDALRAEVFLSKSAIKDLAGDRDHLRAESTELLKSWQTLADFAKTAPGRLPQLVQDAIAKHSQEGGN